MSSQRAVALLGEDSFEDIDLFEDPATGLRGCIAIHSRALGPAFGGCRLARYSDDRSALVDAQRLAEGMSYKNALARLPFGGGKAVLMRPPSLADRDAYFKAFGREVRRLDGRYITAEDVGTTVEDMRQVLSQTSYVSGILRPDGFGGDPGRFTALGVFVSMTTAARKILRRNSLKGVSVAIQGVGAVGGHLCGLLANAGARLFVADPDASRVDFARRVYGAQFAPLNEILELDVQVLAPCAVGGVLAGAVVERIRAPLIVGAANNQLGALEDGDRLHERGIWYLPDFLVNAGGIIAVAREYLGHASELRVRAEVSAIADRAEKLIDEVRNVDEPPARIALNQAREILSRGAP
jgi:leucine dehydrogenase